MEPLVCLIYQAEDAEAPNCGQGKECQCSQKHSMVESVSGVQRGRIEQAMFRKGELPQPCISDVGPQLIHIEERDRETE